MAGRRRVRLAAVAALCAVAAACGGSGNSTGSPGAPRADRTPGAASPQATSPAPSSVFATPTSGDPAATPAARAATITAPVPRSPAPSATAVEGGSRCGTPHYRCVALSDALRWWGGKPALVPREGTGGLRALLHAPRDPDVRGSDDAEYPPSLTYVLPDRHFATASTRRGGTTDAARRGGVVVRTYFATERWLPDMENARFSREVTVRGRDGILTELRTSEFTLRQLEWWVPHGDGTYVVWMLADDTSFRSESALLALANGLVEA